MPDERIEGRLPHPREAAFARPPLPAPRGGRYIPASIAPHPRRPEAMPNPPSPPAGGPGRVLLVFLDGVGIGEGDAGSNPFAAARLPALDRLLGGRMVRESLDGDGRMRGGRAGLASADANLGVDGLPQSGTGQTALLTGCNAAEMYGRHFGPWVPTSLRPMLAAENLLVRAVESGLTASFANAYPLASMPADPRIFRRPAAPPLVARAAGVLTRDLDALRAGRAVASSITNEHWRARVGDLCPDVTPEEAGRTLAALAGEAHVTLFAHYDTDVLGHRGSAGESAAALERVDAFLGALAGALPPDALLVVSSDHGNVESLTDGHTRNPVPVIALGPGRDALLDRVRVLTDVTPALLAALGIAPPGNGGPHGAPSHDGE
jgi:hypothetical protein